MEFLEEESPLPIFEEVWAIMKHPRFRKNPTLKIFRVFFASQDVECELEKIIQHNDQAVVLEVKFKGNSEVWKFLHDEHFCSLEKNNYLQIKKKYPESVAFIEESLGELLDRHLIRMHRFDSDLFSFVCDNPHNQALLRGKEWEVAYKLAQCLSRIHKAGIVHLDLKPENILINYSLYPFNVTKVAICDFQSHLKERKQVKVTKGYMSPEQITQNHHSEHSDIFAFAITVFLLIFNRFPFLEATPTDTFYRYFAENRHSIYWENVQKKMGVKITPEEELFFTRCFSPKKEERPTMSEIKCLIRENFLTQLN